MLKQALAALTTAAIITGPAPAGGDLEVVAVDPAPRSLTVRTGASISVTFDRPVATSTVNAASFKAFGRWSGPAAGAITFSNDDRTATLDPTHPLSAGESVTVMLSHDIEDTDGAPLRPGGFSWQFWTRAGVADLTYEQIDVLSTHPEQNSRAYGGLATDLNHDRFPDITIVNEDTADLRVFLNKADGTGLFDDYLEPPTPIGNRASPSEPADFNGDGHVDICVADINDGTISVVLGIGDGTFHPRQVITVGSNPRGIAVLDVDGDGDVDIANTNSGSSNVSIMLNDGTGVFGAAAFFDAGISGEYALAAADMNEDGLLDLIVASRSARRVVVATGNGDGTFTPQTDVSSGGQTWMLVCGDVNGDGHEDIATANSGSNNGRILLGDGNGGLVQGDGVGTDSFPLATDLADLDGDGDLDWLMSSFGGDWELFVNDGTGNYVRDQEFPAPDAASCTLPFDFDNDGDLDIALIDELADVVILMRSVGSPCPADLDGSGDVGFGDVLAVLAAWGDCGKDCPADLDGSGDVGFPDLLVVLAAWGDC